MVFHRYWTVLLVVMMLKIICLSNGVWYDCSFLEENLIIRTEEYKVRPTSHYS